MFPAFIFAAPYLLSGVYTAVPAHITPHCFWYLHFMNGISLCIKESNVFSMEDKVDRSNEKYVILYILGL
jgi:hypothetical protein